MTQLYPEQFVSSVRNALGLNNDGAVGLQANEDETKTMRSGEDKKNDAAEPVNQSLLSQNRGLDDNPPAYEDTTAARNITSTTSSSHRAGDGDGNQNCSNCRGCTNCTNCSNCQDCHNSQNLSNCRNVNKSSNCTNSTYLEGCTGCSNSHHMTDCINCSNCSNLTGQSNLSNVHG